MNTNEVNENSAKQWYRILRDLGRKRHLHALDPSEAQREFENASEAQLSAKEVESIVEQVVSGDLAIWDTPSWLEAVESPIGQAALTDGLTDQENSVDDDQCADDQQRLEGEDGPSETPEVESS